MPYPKATHLLVVIDLKNRHAAQSKADLLMRLTCNKGLTNPEYKSTQQDLTEIKLIRRRNAGLGSQGMALAINKVLLHKCTLTKFFNSTFKTSQEPYMNLPRSIMRS